MEAQRPRYPLGLIPGNLRLPQGPAQLWSAMTPGVRQRLLGAVLVSLAALLAWVATHGGHVERAWQRATASAGQGAAGVAPSGVFDGADADRTQLPIALERVASGISEPTDIQFPPGNSAYAVVLQKTGTACWLRLDNGVHGELFSVEVESSVEQGLLGLAFHPGFAKNGRFFINYVVRGGETSLSRVAEWYVERASNLSRAKPRFVRIVLEVPQPYPNHKGGQLAFGPDGDLYIGYGDGGSQGDPHGNAQNPKALLGKMLRIDLDRRAEGNAAYAVPGDNPFRADARYRPEVWALGLRNPWRYSFDARGRLIVADVGADRWEEIDVVEAGDNLGWNRKEGFACMPGAGSACDLPELRDPIYVYSRADGFSITGGYEYQGSRIPKLRGLYVFGDFGSGRLYALALPSQRERVGSAIALGRFAMQPSTFGRDAHGEVYVASFGSGEIFRFAKPPVK